MRTLMLAGALLAACSSPSKLYVATESGVQAMTEAQIEALAERIHDEEHHCGGFMVFDDAGEASAASRPEKPIDYTLDRAEIVHAIVPQLDEAKLLGTIRELSAMPNRYFQSASGAAASGWLRDRWRSFTTRSDVTVELVDHGWAQKSVVMTIPGSVHPEQIVVIGGHLDSIGPGMKNSDAPGADDDASGIATLTEVARVLLANDYRPAKTLMFVAYAAEEVGLRGSQLIAKQYASKTVGALQLDMTNYQGSDKDIWLMKDFTSAKQNAFVGTLIDTYVGATWGQDACGYACSDHASWYRQGVPASMPFESRMKDNNKAIHTKRDTLEQSDNNVKHAIKFARLGAAYAIEMTKGSLGGEATGESHPWRWVAMLLGGIGVAGLLAKR